jgi:hypothetical protein
MIDGWNLLPAEQQSQRNCGLQPEQPTLDQNQKIKQKQTKETKSKSELIFVGFLIFCSIGGGVQGDPN